MKMIIALLVATVLGGVTFAVLYRRYGTDCIP